MDLSRPLAGDPYSLMPPLPTFALTSDDLTEGAELTAALTEDGGSTSPHLAWAGFPAATRSFVVSCFDPDAPGPAGFWHWTVFGLPASTTSLPTGVGGPDGTGLPAGAVQTLNDGGTRGYTGAAPPRGDRVHRYVFAVHALDIAELGLDDTATPTAVALAATFHGLARATLIGTFRRDALR